MSSYEVAVYVFVGFLATFGARVLPYLLFSSKSEGASLAFVQKNMPLMIMVVLVFYTLFGLDFTRFETAFVSLACCVGVLALQIWLKNALASMFFGICLYMIFSRLL